MDKPRLPYSGNLGIADIAAPASYSRRGKSYDLTSPIYKSKDYDSIPAKLKAILAPKRFYNPQTPVRIRVKRAMAKEEERINQTLKVERGRHVKNSYPFVTTSREYHYNLRHSQSPPLGQYTPKYSALELNDPTYHFSKASTHRQDLPQRSYSVEPQLNTTCSKSHLNSSIEEHGGRIPGVPFEKQKARESFVDEKGAPHEKRFEIVHGEGFDIRRTHDFGTDSPRKTLFPMPRHLLPYSRPPGLSRRFFI